MANSHKFRQKPQVAGTNTRSAPRRLAPRRPCCLLCSARARSGSRARQLPGAFRWELGLVAPLLPAAPLFPAFGIAPSPDANPQPKALETKNSFPFRNRWHTNEIASRKPVRLTHQSKCNRAGRTSYVFQAQSTDLPWAYTAGPSRGLRAREVRQAIIWRSRKGQGYYGSAQTITRRCRSSLDLSAFAKGPASRISRAPAIRCATKMNSETERSGSALLKAAVLPQCGVANWRPRSSGLGCGLGGDTRLAARMNRKTFSESFSKWVRNGSSLQRTSYLILFEKSHIFASKTGREPPNPGHWLHS